jgi:hypothetical protein
MEIGARPGEVRRVTAATVNLDLGIWTFLQHKTAANRQAACHLSHPRNGRVDPHTDGEVP